MLDFDFNWLIKIAKNCESGNNTKEKGNCQTLTGHFNREGRLNKHFKDENIQDKIILSEKADQQ